MKVVLVNDTSLWNTHFGCQLVGQTYREQFARTNLELLATFPLYFDENHPAFKKADFVIVNGEGSLHHNQNLHLVRIAQRYPSVLINTVYQEIDIENGLENFLFISFRDRMSRAAAGTNFTSSLVTPDVIFASILLNAFAKETATEAGIGCTDNVLDPNAGFGPKTSLVSEYLIRLCKFQRLCIGRLHAAIAASVLRIPFSTWSSNTHKIEGLMEEMGVAHLHKTTQKEALEVCPMTFDPKIDEFTRSAKVKVHALFDRLAQGF